MKSRFFIWEKKIEIDFYDLETIVNLFLLVALALLTQHCITLIHDYHHQVSNIPFSIFE